MVFETVFTYSKELEVLKTPPFFYVLVEFSRSMVEGTMSMTVNGAVLVLLALAFSTEAKLVNVTLYSEALCPDCAQFVRTDLSRAVEEVSG